LDEYLTRKVLPRLGRHKIEDRLFSRLLPPSHTPQKFFAQILADIIANIGLHATSRCSPTASKLKMFQLLQLLKSRISFPIKDSIAGNKSEASFFGEATNLYQFLTMRNDKGQ